MESNLAGKLVYTLRIEHGNGNDVTVHTTKADADETLYKYVAEWWSDDGPDGEMPEDRDEAVRAYFDHNTMESADISGTVIRGEVALVAPPSQTPILDAWFRQRAKEEYEHEGDIEIDEGAVVSYGDEGGAYVAAWVWVERSPIECHCGKQMFVTDGVAHHGVPDEIDAAADLDHTAEEMEPEDASKCRTCEGMGYKSAAVTCVVCKGRGHFDSPAEARAAQKETRGING